MKRRDFITLLGSVAATWPLAAGAQQAAKLPTIGLLGSTTPLIESQRVAAFLQRLHELGWIEGRTVAIEYHNGLAYELTDLHEIGILQSPTEASGTTCG